MAQSGQTKASTPNGAEPVRRKLPAPKRLAVASGKGGVGKTWFAITLAGALAERGENVLLVDGDLGLANVDVQLGLTAGRDFASVISGQMSMDEAIVKYQNHPELDAQSGANAGAFDILAGRSGSATFAALSQLELKGFSLGLHALENVYDRVVVDLGAGVDQTVMTLAGAGETSNDRVPPLVAVVLTDEPTSLTDAYALIKMMVMRGNGENLRIVVNMADDVASGKATYQAIQKACQNFLKVDPPLAGIVRRDSNVKESIRRQTSLLSAFPVTPAAKDVAAIAAKLAKS